MILVTGGTGLLGSHLLYELCGNDEEVYALYRNRKSIEKAKKVFGYYPENNRFQQINWIKGDILDILSLEAAFSKADKIYHCAAVVSFNPSDRKKIMKINHEGTANVVNTALDCDIKKLCYSSSVSALGSKKNGEPIDEKTPWETNKKPSNYSTSKHLAEMEVWRAAEEGLDTVIVNPCTIIGPGDWSSGSPALIRQMDEGLKFYTEGGTAFVDVRDVAKGMVRLMESDINKEQYILAAENRSFKSVFDTIAGELGKQKPSVKAGKTLTEIVWRLEKLKSEITGTEPVITKESARMAHQTDRYSNRKIKDAMGKEFIAVDDAIKHACRLYTEEKNER